MTQYPVRLRLIIVITYLWLYSSLLDLGRFFSFLIYTQSVGILERGITPLQGRYLHRETQTQNKRTHTSMP
jgi:hypothetical protein